jgi:hypothetical protein
MMSLFTWPRFVKRILIVLLGLVMVAGRAGAQGSPLPKIITDGFDAYQKSGIDAACDVWLAGSPIQNDTNGRAGVVNSIHTIETEYGKFTGYESAGTVIFSPSVRQYYLVFLYEKGPLYAWFEVYTYGGKEIIPSFLCNTNASTILPNSFFKK